MKKTDIAPYPISFFAREYKLGNLDLKPKYQRNPVWTKDQRAYLIDTVLKGLPMPKIFLEAETDPRRATTKYKVVDGQQRLLAILDFFDGKLDVSAEYDPQLGGLSFQDLPADIQRDFLDYTVTVELLKGVSDSEIRDMFKRLNKNTEKLKPQELRHAQYDGDFINLAEELANETYWREKKILWPSEIRRMRDVEFVSELLVATMYGIQDRTKKLNDYYAANETMQDKRKVRRQFKSALSAIKKILPDLETTRFRKRGDFYSLFYTVHSLLARRYKFDRNLNEIGQALVQVSQWAKIDSPIPSMVRYYESAIQAVHHERNRRLRSTLLRDLIEPLLVKTDERRAFNETQRQFIWHQSEEKVCAICHQPVDSYRDYEADHIVPWSKGGPTDISNGQITHKSCNRQKRAEVAG